MPFLSTALSALGRLGSGLTSTLGRLATPALAAATVYSAVRPSSSGGYYPAPAGGALAMPGGASLAYPLLGAGAGAALGGLMPFTPGSPYGGIGEPGGWFGGSSQIVPTQVRGGLRMPHTVMVPHPTQQGSYVTYVKAPPVRYRVSVRGAGRRRCSGGR